MRAPGPFPSISRNASSALQLVSCGGRCGRRGGRAFGRGGQLGEWFAGDGGADCERRDLPCARIAGARCAALVAGEVEVEGIGGGTDCAGWGRGLRRVGEGIAEGGGAGGAVCGSWWSGLRELGMQCTRFAGALHGA
jgi:hypothetical protein